MLELDKKSLSESRIRLRNLSFSNEDRELIDPARVLNFVDHHTDLLFDHEIRMAQKSLNLAVTR